MTRRVLPPVALVLLVNLVMLLSARANRAGEPESVLALTERELRLERASDRDSAQRLRLDPWNPSEFLFGTPVQQDWLTEARLSALGFDCRRPIDRVAGKTATSTLSCGLPRRAFVVYEYEGPAWRRAVAALQRRRDEASAADAAKPYSSVAMIDNQIRYGSRLVAVDVSSDAASLRRAYPDRHRHLILPARARAWLEPAIPPAVPALRGSVGELTPSLVAPARFRDRLSPLTASDWSLSKAPRYMVEVAIGRHLEPWIIAIEPIDTGVVPH